jgi:hypothetical protein
MSKENNDPRNQIINISRQFPTLRFGQFLENVFEFAGERSLHVITDEKLLELCKSYASVMIPKRR